jgi:hypothetical protein
LQLVFSAAHLPLPSQASLQHSALLVHDCPSEVQAAAEHCPVTQLRLQQSGGALHFDPADAHTERFDAQVFVVGSHSFEQQSASVAQTSANL